MEKNKEINLATTFCQGMFKNIIKCLTIIRVEKLDAGLAFPDVSSRYWIHFSLIEPSDGTMSGISKWLFHNIVTSYTKICLVFAKKMNELTQKISHIYWEHLQNMTIQMYKLQGITD